MTSHVVLTSEEAPLLPLATRRHASCAGGGNATATPRSGATQPRSVFSKTQRISLGGYLLCFNSRKKCQKTAFPGFRPAEAPCIPGNVPYHRVMLYANSRMYHLPAQL